MPADKALQRLMVTKPEFSLVLGFNFFLLKELINGRLADFSP